MDIKILKIDLPPCEHIHFTLQYPDGRTEMVAYHMSDFRATENTQGSDPIFLQLKTMYKAEETSARKQPTREELKTAFTSLTLTK